MKLLLIEDNLELSKNLATYLSNEGNICEIAYTQFDGIDKILSFEYDVIIIDLMLPDGNGLEIVRQIKSEKLNSGIIIITAKNALDDKIKGLEIGADDYITKPFHLSELNARVKTLYRRLKFDGKQELVFNEISVNTVAYTVKINTVEVGLTRKEYELLLFFLANKNLLVTKQSVAEHLWGDYIDTYDNFDFVYQHIKNLRKKITAVGGNEYIKTIYGLGYKFTSE